MSGELIYAGTLRIQDAVLWAAIRFVAHNIGFTSTWFIMDLWLCCYFFGDWLTSRIPFGNNFLLMNPVTWWKLVFAVTLNSAKLLLIVGCPLNYFDM